MRAVQVRPLTRVSCRVSCLRWGVLCVSSGRASQWLLSCPNTAWLLFLLFAIAIIAASAAAMYLSKTKINFAGLGIGVVRVLERSS